jgi:hypothetical protein
MTIAAFYGRVSTDSFDKSEDVKSVAGLPGPAGRGLGPLARGAGLVPPGGPSSRCAHES